MTVIENLLEQVAVTTNFHSHVIPAMRHEAAGQMDAMLGDRADENTGGQDQGESEGDQG